MNFREFYWSPNPNDVVLTLLILSILYANECWNPNDVIDVTRDPNPSHTPFGTPLLTPPIGDTNLIYEQ